MKITTKYIIGLTLFVLGSHVLVFNFSAIGQSTNSPKFRVVTYNSDFTEDIKVKAMGLVVLNNGIAQVNEPRLTSRSVIFLTHQIDGGVKQGFVRPVNRVDGSGFRIQSDSVQDNSIVGWMIVEALQ